jgi:hypothetical protein
MDTHKITRILVEYKTKLDDLGVKPERILTHKTFRDYTEDPGALLSHALYLVDGALVTAQDKEKYGKLNRHLTAIQMCLSFAGIYSLDQLMNHNKP